MYTVIAIIFFIASIVTNDGNFDRFIILMGIAILFGIGGAIQSVTGVLSDINENLKKIIDNKETDNKENSKQN